MIAFNKGFIIFVYNVLIKSSYDHFCTFRGYSILSPLRSALHPEKLELESLLKEVTAEVISDSAWYDQMILKEIKQSPDMLIRRFHFHAFFKHGLNHTLMHLIQSRQNDFRELFAAPIILSNFRADEVIIVRFLQIYKEEIKQTLGHRNARNENTLHVLINKGFQKAIKYLLDNYDVTRLCFEHNFAGDTPLMTMIPHDTFGEQKLKVWNYMVMNNSCSLKFPDSGNLPESIVHKNKKGSNVLHLCAENTIRKENESSILLRMIVSCPDVSKDVILRALNTDRKGALPLYLCDHEETCVALLDIVPIHMIPKRNLDSRHNNIMHIFGSQKHFAMVIKKLGQCLPRKELQDLLFEKNDNGNNAMMSCALKDGHEILAQFLFMIFLKRDDLTRDRIDNLLHDRNKRDNTLLSLTLQHKGTTMIPYQLLLKMEKDHHQNDLSKLTKCFKKNLRPSLEVWQALSEIEESYPKNKFSIVMIWIRTFFFSMLWPAFVVAFDVGSDYYLLNDYHPDSADSPNNCTSIFTTKHNNLDLQNDEDLCMIPQKLNKESRFNYLLAFILMPHLFYACEFIQSLEYTKMFERIKKSSINCAKNPFQDILKNTLMLLFCIASSLFKLVLWPFYMIFNSFISEGKAATSSGKEYFSLTRNKDENTILEARARIIEACTEASFQPILVLYMVLPDIIAIFTHSEEDHAAATPALLQLRAAAAKGYQEHQYLLYKLLGNPQIISILGSIISLVLSFDMYYQAQKRGALGLAGNIAGRLLLLSSTLLLVVSRLLALVICAYCFGEGSFYPLILLVTCHIILMSFLHYATSYEWEIVEAGESVADGFNDKTKASIIPRKFRITIQIIYQCLINGIGNLYIHNWIVNYHPRKFGVVEKKTTFLRQVMFDLIFAIENMAIVVVSANSPYLQTLPREILIIILAGHLFGVIFKGMYYQYWHMWKLSFNVVRVAYDQRCPRVSFSFPYYWFRKPGTCRFGPEMFDANIRGGYITRPSVDLIFNRQSVRTNTENKTRRDAAEYVHMPSLRTDSEKRLISAIVNASSARREGTSTSSMRRITNMGLDISDLRTLFEEYVKELQAQESEIEHTESCNPSTDRRVRFKGNEKRFGTIDTI